MELEYYIYIIMQWDWKENKKENSIPFFCFLFFSLNSITFNSWANEWKMWMNEMAFPLCIVLRTTITPLPAQNTYTHTHSARFVSEPFKKENVLKKEKRMSKKPGIERFSFILFSHIFWFLIRLLRIFRWSFHFGTISHCAILIFVFLLLSLNGFHIVYEFFSNDWKRFAVVAATAVDLWYYANLAEWRIMTNK